MEWQFIPYMLVFLAAAGASALFALVGWRRRVGIKSFVGLSCLTVVWALVYMIEIGCRSLSCGRFWAQVRFSFGPMLTIVWLVFALEYIGKLDWLTRRNFVFLLAVMVVLWAGIWTNDAHGLVFYDAGIEIDQTVSHFTFLPGPLYWLHINFVYLLYIAAFFLILLVLVQMPRFYRGRAGAIALAALLPGLANLTFLADLLPEVALNWTPVALTLRDGIILWSLLHRKLVGGAPVVRSLVIESMNDAILVVDAHDRVVDANAAAQELFGGELIGLPVSQAFDGQEGLLACYRETETKARVEITTPEGRYLDAHLSTLRNPDGTHIGRLLVLHDITGRKLTEQQLRTLSQAVEQSPSTIVITDMQGNIEYANPKFTEVTGYTIAEALGRNPSILKSEHTPPEVYRELWETIMNGEEWRGEFLNKKKSGELYWEYAVIAPVRSEAGEILHFVAVKEDISERKAAEEALHKANERLELLRRVDAELSSKLNVDYVLTIAIDVALRLTLADAGYIALQDGEDMRLVRILGDYPPEQVGAILPPSGIAARVMANRQALLLPDVATDPDYIPVRASTQAQILCPLISGERLVGLLSVESSRPDCFTPDSFEFAILLAARIAVAIDNAQMYEEREQLVQELEAFARTVAHDLKNPVGAILGYAEMLEELRLTEESRKNYIAKMGNLAAKMNTIIESLLTLSGVRRVQEVETAPLDMRQIIVEVQDRLDRMVTDYGAEITVRAPETWPCALGYAPWVEEVWMNYISNAIKYGRTPEAAPQIELGAAPDGPEQVRFWVRDYGPGIPPAQQAQLFTEFTRLGDIAIEGHGLGLSIVKRIVEKLGGEVGVESTPGEGSLFSFTLPAADAAE